MKQSPVIGVLAIKGRSADPFGRWSWEVRRVVRELRKRGIKAVGIPLEFLEHAGNKVKGYWPSHNKERLWNSAMVPLPRIFYNRILSRGRESRESSIRILEQMRSEGRIIFNPRYLSKEDMYKYLLESEWSSFVPETVSKPAVEDVLACLKKWPQLYLKPWTGCQGRGIYQLENCKSYIQLKGVLKGEVKKIRIKDEASLAKWLELKFKKRRYVVQQGVDVDTFMGRRYDLRVLVQKNRLGLWQYVGAGARLGLPGHVVTHVPNGGKIFKPGIILKKKLGSEGWKKSESQLAQIAEGVAKTVESNYGLPFGIFAMDVTVDQNGSFWILEVNAKPGTFDEPAIQKLSDDLLAEYLRFLSEQGGSHE